MVIQTLNSAHAETIPDRGSKRLFNCDQKQNERY